MFNQTSKQILSIDGFDSSKKCTFSILTEDVNASVIPEAQAQAKAQGITDAQIQQQIQETNTQLKQSIGINMKCSFSTSYLTELLTNWLKGDNNFGSDQLSKCSITDANGKSVQSMGSVNVN